MTQCTLLNLLNDYFSYTKIMRDVSLLSKPADETCILDVVSVGRRRPNFYSLTLGFNAPHTQWQALTHCYKLNNFEVNIMKLGKIITIGS